MFAHNLRGSLVMHTAKKASLVSICFFLFLFSGVSRASIIEFHFTGQLTVVANDNSLVGQAPIDSTFRYNTDLGIGSGDLTIAPLVFFGSDLSVHDISMQKVDGGNGNLILGNMLADFSGNIGIPVSMVWDATGLMNAIDLGMQAGDVISGTTMKRDGAFYADVSSAIVASDNVVTSPIWVEPATYLNQGAAPMATTTLNTTTLCTYLVDCMGNTLSGGIGFTDDGIAGSPLVDGPFTGMQISLDIGSGNSLTVLSVSPVPVPAAVWLFVSGFVGLIAVTKRRKN